MKGLARFYTRGNHPKRKRRHEAGAVVEVFFQQPRAVDDAGQPVRQHQHVGADACQQEHRRDRQLNDVPYLSRLDFHCLRRRKCVD